MLSRIHSVLLSVFRSFAPAEEEFHDAKEFQDHFEPIARPKRCTVLMEPAKRRVSFHPKIKVILVPTASEYHDAGCDLWWNESDYVSMREDFRQEIGLALRNDPSLNNDIFEAMNRLYQPNYEPRDMTPKQVKSTTHTVLTPEEKVLDPQNLAKLVFSPRPLHRKIFLVP
jgi:hypothetical protein